MREYYKIHSPSQEEEERIGAALPVISRVPDGVRAQVVTAWCTVWRSSPYRSLERFPYSLDVPAYSLIQHTLEVVEIGEGLAGFARRRWGTKVDEAQLLATLVLHGVDKPLLYAEGEYGVVLSETGRDIPHGVLGSLLLQQLGLDGAIVGPVATYAIYSPWHGSSAAAWVLHYADFFCADHVMRDAGKRPFYPPKAYE